MSFADVAKRSSEFTRTENGAVALNTTGNKNLDLYSSIGGLRNAYAERMEALFEKAYKEDPLLATKIVFYARDIRGGLGERRVFRVLIRHMAYFRPEAIRPNIDLIGVFGRYDDMYNLIGTQVEDDMWLAMKNQLEEDIRNCEEGKAISLLAKWIKSADASSPETRKLGILTAQKMGYSVYDFKRIIKKLRKHIGVIESLMSTGQWDKIEYSTVPSRAMKIYRKAFARHDAERYDEYIGKVVKGEAKINSSTLYPYDLIEALYKGAGHSIKEDPTIEAQWRQLPDYVGKEVNAIVMADTSGSMFGRPLFSAIGLAIYFAERNKGAYHNLWMSFSRHPKFHTLKGNTLAEKVSMIDKSDWMMNTNLEAAFDKILNLAIENNIPQEEMPKSLIVISDMEIDYCGNKEWTFFDKMTKKYNDLGYDIPNIIYWNVESRHEIFHADAKRKGVQLVSGQSASTFKNLISCVGMTPVEAMYYTINSERYEAITVDT